MIGTEDMPELTGLSFELHEGRALCSSAARMWRWNPFRRNSERTDRTVHNGAVGLPGGDAGSADGGIRSGEGGNRCPPACKKMEKIGGIKIMKGWLVLCCAVCMLVGAMAAAESPTENGFSALELPADEILDMNLDRNRGTEAIQWTQTEDGAGVKMTVA